MQAIPMIIAAAGTVAQMSATNEANKERRSILNRQMEDSEKATDKSIDLVQQEGQRFDQQQRLQGLDQAEDKTYQQTQADIQGAGGASINAAADAANVSDDFVRTKAQRAIEEGTRLTSIAREAAKARAPGQLRMDDSLSMARMAGELGSTWGTARNMGRARGMAAQGVEEPGYGNLGRIASAVGGGMAQAGFGQPAGTDMTRSGVSAWDNALARTPRWSATGINFGGR